MRVVPVEGQLSRPRLAALGSDQDTSDSDRGKVMDSEDAIKREFQARDLDWISAIQRLQNLGYAQEDAEDMVAEWNTETLAAR